MNLKKCDKKKIFVTGVSGAGKTTFSKKYTELFNTEYFDFEKNWGGYESDAQIQYDNIIKKYTDVFITDAIPYTYLDNKMRFLDYYNDNKNDIKIICVCCTDKKDYDNRLIIKYYRSKKQAYQEFKSFYFNTIQYYLNLGLDIDFYDSSKNSYISYDELLKNIEWVNDNSININREDFKKYLDNLTYDKYYQDIECIDFIGYTNSSKTWDNIKDLVSWKDQKVADLGCFHGYFSFKAAKMGAIVTGFDISSSVLKTTDMINTLEGDIINTHIWQGGDEIPEEFKITLALNVIHHFKDLELGLKNIKSKTVIFETNQELVDIISKNFKIIKKIQSHRNDINRNPRIILLCEKI